MSTITDQTTENSLGAYFVRLFKVDAEEFRIRAQLPRRDRASDCLNRPYELSDLMRQATAAGFWPRPN